jgi:hypothetical protein
MIAKIQSYLHPRTWTWSRIAQLLLGFLSLVAGLDSGERLITVAGIALTISALFRIGCAGQCETSFPPKS